jgi:uncharacterized delta-60 repeat protein
MLAATTATLAATFLPLPAQALPPQLQWKQQLGTSSDDNSYGVAVDSNGNVYISGFTAGALAGTKKGSYDAWVAKYNSSGKLQWKQQLGTSTYDNSYGVATDSNGNVYISGATDGALAGTNKGHNDAWVAKYNSSGKLQWKQQLGTSTYDNSYGVATDSNGNVYISGATDGALAGTNKGSYDAWVAKYNSNGKLQWKQQLGSSNNDFSEGVATDSNGNVYISGWTYGDLAGTNKGVYPDAWVAKYNSSGSLQWKQQLGTSDSDTSNDVATDSNGNVYISGVTYGDLAGTNKGYSDAWVAKYNSSGKLQWKQQLGSSNNDFSYGVATDSSGNVYISGYTFKGYSDAWVAKYNSSGSLQWTKQLGSTRDDFSLGVATDSSGNVYISGYTEGDLAGTNKGYSDAWVAKYSQQSQPYQGSRKPPRQDR